MSDSEFDSEESETYKWEFRVSEWIRQELHDQQQGRYPHDGKSSTGLRIFKLKDVAESLKTPTHMIKNGQLQGMMFSTWTKLRRHGFKVTDFGDIAYVRWRYWYD